MKIISLVKLGTIATSLIFLLFSLSVQAAGPGARTGHNNVSKLTTGSWNSHRRYAPVVHIEHGCQPYPAVDNNGNYSAGLQDSGSHNGGCSDSNKGQIYVRSKCKNGYCGYMYVFYMPKDNGVPVPSLGHRHDFEEVVIWTRNGSIIGAAYSRHGDYSYDTNPHLVNGRVNAAYRIDGVTHSMGRIRNGDRGRGKVWPVATWDRMTTNAKRALNDTSNFPTSVFPARNDNFIAKLNEARTSNVNVTF